MKKELTRARGSLGMFAGVFTPSILTILGLILFLRLGYVVGGLGLIGALGVIALGNAISILTSMSLAAVTTNLRVKGGGVYYLIARTLGVEHGGTIGLVMFVAQSVSIGFYCVGFAEAVVGLMGVEHPFAIHAVAAAAVGGLFILAWLGADWATRFQYVVMALLAAALISFGVGAIENWNGVMLRQNLAAPQNPLPFWVAFAIFFPAVTGFTQGVNMSGDLRDAGRAIPLGTFLAVGLSFAIYLIVPVMLAATLAGGELRSNYDAMKSVAAISPLIDAGVIAATLSSALASFLGAPRILQSLSRDRIFPVLLPFARGTGPASNPRRATLLSAAVAVATVAIGDLNQIASIVAMFFLISYGLINYATYFEAKAASPAFRPTYRFYDHRISLVAALGCLAAMIIIDVTAGIVAVLTMVAIYQYLKYRGAAARWADGRRSHHLQILREHLFEAAKADEHPRDWRPMLLVFSDDVKRRQRLLRFTAWLQGNAGLATVVRIIEGADKRAPEDRENVLEELREAIAESESDAFPMVIAAPDLDSAVPIVIQSAGIGPLRANTVLVNWLTVRPEQEGGLSGIRFATNLRTAAGLGCNLLVLKAADADWDALTDTPLNERVIDVWWTSDKTGELALLFAHLMQRTRDWDEARIRLLGFCDDTDPEERKETLRAMLAEVRVDAEPVAVEDTGPEAIVAHSSLSSVVFLPSIIRGGRFYHPFGGEIPGILDQLRIVVLATATQDVKLDTDPDVEETTEGPT